eukprot:gene18061-20968_t
MASPSYNNVHFVGVARIDGEGIVVASYSHHAAIDIGGVKQVLGQPNLNISAGKHYVFSIGTSAWHLIGDDLNLIYIVICKDSYPQRVAHQCLEELQRNFVNKVGSKASTAKERSLDKTCSQMFGTICVKYDNLSEVDKLAAVAKKVDAVKLVMQENIDIALQNCVKLESIEKAAEELQQDAALFRRGATDLRKKMWWKNIK